MIACVSEIPMHTTCQPITSSLVWSLQKYLVRTASFYLCSFLHFPVIFIRSKHFPHYFVQKLPQVVFSLCVDGLSFTYVKIICKVIVYHILVQKSGNFINVFLINYVKHCRRSSGMMCEFTGAHWQRCQEHRLQSCRYTNSQSWGGGGVAQDFQRLR
jgi:hypothetical protein